MKKLLIIVMALTVSLFAAEDEPFEKSGFLTTESCAKSGSFTTCYLENYFCGSDGCYLTTDENKKTPLVLYSHDDNMIYKLDTSAIKASVLDGGINVNGVAMVGEYDPSTNVIIVQEFKAPPPPKASFFKGCL
jgi:hypothetical protein